MTKQYKKYIETQVKTASKEQLLMMLLDGVIKFAENGKKSIEENKFEDANNNLNKAQKIIIELISAIDQNSLDPKLYVNITSLYSFVYSRLITGNVKHSPDIVKEGIQILFKIRDIWKKAITKMREDVSNGKIASGELYSPNNGVSFQG